MTESANIFDYLDQIRERNERHSANFDDISTYLDLKAREKGTPIHGQFELTPLCNLSCKMCYVHLDPNQMAGRSVISVSAWKELIYHAWEAGMIKATLTGGECLTYPGFDELYLYIHSLGCEAYVMTNGLLLNEKRIAFFKQHMPATIQVTLYGWNDDVYERVTGQRVFSIVTENIRKAIDAGLPILVNVTPSVILGEDVLETVRIGKKLSKAFTVNTAIFEPREETGRSEQRDDPDVELYVKIYRLINEIDGKKNRQVSADELPCAGGPYHVSYESGLKCGGGRSGFVVDWKGTMMPCNRLDMIQGYPFKEGFSSAWTRINQAANCWPRVPQCKGCAYEQVCANCPANMLRFAKPGEVPTALCERTKTLVRNGVCQIPDCE